MLGIAGVPVVDLPPEQLTSTTDKPNSTVAEIARIILWPSLFVAVIVAVNFLLPSIAENGECKREIMAPEKTGQC
jgi:hypothetical protein